LRKKAPQRILVIDIGGSHIKVWVTGRRRPVEIDSGPTMTPSKMVAALRKATADWEYDAVSIGYPGAVFDGRPREDPPNLAPGWAKFDFRKALGRPVKIINDAALQALGSYRGKKMLFLGLGTGLGSALVLEGVLHPLELGDLPYRNGRTYAEYVGKAALERLGKKTWARHALRAVTQLKAALQPDYVVLGGGKAKLLKRLPPGIVRGDNSKAYLGGCRLWHQLPPWHGFPS
jgi:predicted NBD/HSP70 family sugar kinase